MTVVVFVAATTKGEEGLLFLHFDDNVFEVPYPLSHPLLPYHHSYSFAHICYRPYEFQGSYIFSLFSLYIPLPFMKLSLTSLYGSIVVPLLPLLPALLKRITNFRPLQSNTVELLTFYCLIVLLRIGVLYYLPLIVQQRMKTTFDFSDHIVLFYCQIIPILEHYYNFKKPPALPREIDVVGVVSFYLQSVLPLLVCFTVWRETVRTAMWFHTPLESLVAYGFSFLYGRIVLTRIENFIVGGGYKKRRV